MFLYVFVCFCMFLYVFVCFDICYSIVTVVLRFCTYVRFWV